jgi:hypothetical protein
MCRVTPCGCGARCSCRESSWPASAPGRRLDGRVSLVSGESRRRGVVAPCSCLGPGSRPGSRSRLGRSRHRGGTRLRRPTCGTIRWVLGCVVLTESPSPSARLAAPVAVGQPSLDPRLADRAGGRAEGGRVRLDLAAFGVGGRRGSGGRGLGSGRRPLALEAADRGARTPSGGPRRGRPADTEHRSAGRPRRGPQTGARERERAGRDGWSVDAWSRVVVSIRGQHSADCIHGAGLEVGARSSGRSTETARCRKCADSR